MSMSSAQLWSPSSDGSLSDLDLNLSLMKQVQLAVQRVAETQQETEDPLIASGGGPSTEGTGSCVSVGGLEEQCAECRDEIQRLRGEVALLEDELRRKEAPLQLLTDEHLQRNLLALTDSTHQPEDRGRVSDSTHQPEDRGCVSDKMRLLQSRALLNSSLTGISFSSVEWEVTKTDELGLFRKYDHIGSAHGFKFHVQFICREEKDPASQSNEPAFAKIIGLRVKVDFRLEGFLVPLLARSTKECDLMGFYQIYTKFCSCLKQRNTTFKELKKLHGECVQFSDDSMADTLHFTVNRVPVLSFLWGVALTGDVSVSQTLSVTPTPPPNACDEERECLSQLPGLVHRMAEIHGCKHALIQTLENLHPLTDS